MLTWLGNSAGPLRKLRAAERAQRVERLAAHAPGGRHARVPALPAGNAPRQTHPLQNQRQSVRRVRGAPGGTLRVVAKGPRDLL